MIFLNNPKNFNEEKAIFNADDFDYRMLSHVCGEEAVELYIALRAQGYGPVESHAVTFASEIGGHPDSIAAMLAHFESTDRFKGMFSDIMEATPRAELKAIFSARLTEIATFASDAALALRIRMRESRSAEPRAARARSNDEFDHLVHERAIEANDRIRQEMVESSPTGSYDPYTHCTF